MEIKMKKSMYWIQRILIKSSWSYFNYFLIVRIQWSKSSFSGFHPFQGQEMIYHITLGAHNVSMGMVFCWCDDNSGITCMHWSSFVQHPKISYTTTWYSSWIFQTNVLDDYVLVIHLIVLLVWLFKVEKFKMDFFLLVKTENSVLFFGPYDFVHAT